MARLNRDDLYADATLQGTPFCRALTERFDRWLRQLYVTATGAPDRVALVAVGGYGRSELCPQSDLDVLLLHDGRVDIGGLAEQLWYPIWDEGVKLGHAVFTPKEALHLASDELDTATSLLDARHVAGDARITTELVAAARVQWVKGAPRWLPKLKEALTLRAMSPGEVAFHLEPDLKLGRGGLRDVHMLRWLEAVEPGLLDADRSTFVQAHERLLEARIALHRRTGRRGDLLLLQEQDGVAEDLGFDDADALMASVAASARTIGWLADEAFDQVSLAGSRFRRRPKDRRVGPGLMLRDGQMHVDEEIASGTAGCIQLLDVAGAAASREVRLARATLERFARADLQFPDPWPVEVRERFVDLLRCGSAAIPVIETLDHWDLWVRVLPEWAPCRSRPQRNAYHRFTVDRHLCEAAANASSLTGQLTGGAARPDLLVVGTLLHDLGKGYPPDDHSEVGARLVTERIGPRMGFPPEDVAVLGDLVRHHLLLPDVATRRDLSDERTIQLVADAVVTESTLRLLHALTEADSIATGPAAWGDWKASLVRELVDKTGRHLAGATPSDVEGVFPTVRHRDLIGRERPVIEVGGNTITVVDADRPGLFAKVAGVLALNGLDVLGANAHSEDSGVALAEFTVANSFGGPVNWDKVRADVALAAAGRLAVRARLAERARVYGRRRPVTLTWAPFDRKVVTDNDASETATVIEVRAPDAVGLLYRVTSAIAEMDLDIRSAKIQTLGDHVVDAFYVRDLTGGKVEAPALDEVERALLHALHE